ncbi:MULTISPECIES: Gfo/Idh/MocA family oxidoreductase [unclassified Leeuwenhoekiella]|uniref:Gfo/Idh/MocA family protein n=1 Tax=unclassified Leeuwenhoekiella TaxID=2615029 RepID=UPI000C6A3336|nr:MULTISPECIES: Gfo/Idh/MocA family oxidoreductase [unclassified Leeuwenhoekiella]MAW94776.1 oxidoreductase [Leeuwenhoekiella sp.]MBA79495.1 oxidoreductase [Leeuwenhoekiella sp.]|tara:strand:+ start:3965 stop:5443 length:1479 start_codon:yes stop_codon:yes gene_type:complete
MGLQDNKRRDFLKKSSIGALGLMTSGSILATENQSVAKTSDLNKDTEIIRTAHIGVGGMGAEDLKAIASHPQVVVKALCDVDAIPLAVAHKNHPEARIFFDYRAMLRELGDEIDAVIISTPDHTHAPAAMLAMENNKPVYCQKSLTHYVAQSREMRKMGADKNLVTQMGIQVHSFYDYKLATLLIQSGIIGKVHTVYAWSPKNWGYNGPEPEGSDPVPPQLDWNLWLGTAKERPYKADFYHPANWRKLIDYGCATLGDMGVHIFDTPYNALALDVPKTIKNDCRPPNDFGYPEQNMVTYEFPGTKYTTERLKWIWYDGPGAPILNEDLMLPDSETTNLKTNSSKNQSLADKTSLDAGLAEKGKLPEQGAMFVGKKGRLLLPHFMQLPVKIKNGKYVDISKEIAKISEEHQLEAPVRDYKSESPKHYHEFIDACLGKGKTSAPFDYGARLTETILLGVIAGRFPNQTLHWDAETALFEEEEANQYLENTYRNF